MVGSVRDSIVGSARGLREAEGIDGSVHGGMGQ